MIDFHPELPTSPLNYAISFNNLPDGIKDQMHKNYSYLWAKASLMIKLGFDTYRENDYFHFPLSEWLNADFNEAIHQIVNDLRGCCPEFAIIISNIETVSHILFSLHFRLNNTITTGTNNIIQVDASHLVEEDQITLYFIQKQL